ncbi:2-polyprenyl-6-methoxyphenol hydroxylase [Streptomyces sp. 2112.3]|uniref:FAD-dependent monooxygenase n=1 Tax=Streptomyces sp. 2112.3 TaxID=1881023 RepID=UPI0008994829|nr:FAD-dependent monooxygenase [Streptomyces sp. 2112.3]SEF13500.1 2-polyprenyl-6-methoxyphenol hydroxylase [Streptomyces sp. 2112.3]
MKTVLISGASVAGLTTAYWLRRRGYAPTVVERAPGIRPGGQAIDVRGVALGVLDRMGLLAEARHARTRMRGMSMHDGDGHERWRSTEMTFSSGRLDSGDIELLRDDLTQLLYRHTLDGVEYVFNDSLVTLDQGPHGVNAGFESGRHRTFDLVVGADGLHSKVRQLAFGEERQFIRHLGPHLAVFSTDNFLHLDNWQVWLQDGTASYCVYPVRDNTEIRATLGFLSEPLGHDHRDTERQKSLLAERMAHLGGDTPRLLEAMWDASEFYFDAMAQIHMDRWSDCRTVLIGDAGYCPSPLSGQGTSLALVGAYVLADELDRADGDHRTAFPRYEERLRPFVELNQALATENSGGMASEESLERAKNALSLDR